MTRGRARRYRTGSTIGSDLTVLGAVDEGGNDPVYIVWHHRAWCPMACKVFGSVRQARHEAEIHAGLAHPNVVRLLGTSFGDPPLLLMEVLDGPTLRRLIGQHPKGLRLSDALRIAIHLGAALAHLHERSILHLDVKPRNVAVVRGRPVLFDFGLARRRSEWAEDRLEGTDPYMAPEQCRREPVSPATDVYALGVTLYEALAGLRPFPDGSRRRSFPQIAMEPVPLRDRRPSVPRALAATVHACLTPDPAVRPALAALLVDLHRHIRGGAPMWPAGFEPRPGPTTEKSRCGLKHGRTRGETSPGRAVPGSGQSCVATVSP